MTKPRNLLLGIVQVATGRREGLAEFGSTTQAFLSSLAPLLAFPIAGALIEVTWGAVAGALATVAISIILQLAPPVVSYQLAVRWGREEQWLHYATAYNWCFWALPIVMALLTVLFGVAIAGGLPGWAGANGVLGGLGLYSLWLHWFLARHALALSKMRAGVLVVAVNVAALALVLLPAQLG